MIKGVNAFDDIGMSWTCSPEPWHPQIRFTHGGEREQFVIRDGKQRRHDHLADLPLLLLPTSDAASETWSRDAPTEQPRSRQGPGGHILRLFSMGVNPMWGTKNSRNSLSHVRPVQSLLTSVKSDTGRL
jgi:hypothetical protein